jgi:hypothetical protein
LNLILSKHDSQNRHALDPRVSSQPTRQGVDQEQIVQGDVVRDSWSVLSVRRRWGAGGTWYEVLFSLSFRPRKLDSQSGRCLKSRRHRLKDSLSTGSGSETRAHGKKDIPTLAVWAVKAQKNWVLGPIIIHGATMQYVLTIHRTLAGNAQHEKYLSSPHKTCWWCFRKRTVTSVRPAMRSAVPAASSRFSHEKIQKLWFCSWPLSTESCVNLKTTPRRKTSRVE